jgi:hypothetical protein
MPRRSRRYSAISNYRIGQRVRMLVVFVVGFLLALFILLRTGIVHNRDQAVIGGGIFGAVVAMVAKRHT